MKELKDMSPEELWALFPIILKPHNRNYKSGMKLKRQLFFMVYAGRRWHGSTILAVQPLRAAGWIVMAQDATLQTLDFM